jgi:DNA-binding LacI/PurR family transcriptional regulator
MPVPADAARLQLTAWIDAQGLAPGSRLPSERALALLLGTSRAAVNRMMTALVEAGLVRQASRKVRLWNGSPPATARAGLVLIIAEATSSPLPNADPGQLIGTHMLHRGIHDELRRRGLASTTIAPNRFATGDLRSLVAGRPLGVLLTTAADDPAMRDRLLRNLPGLHLPAAVPGDHFTSDELASLPADAVSSDHAGGAEALVRLLAGRGRRRIGFLGLRSLDGPVRTDGWIVNRRSGWRRACSALGLTPGPELDLLRIPVFPGSPRAFADQTTLTTGGLAPLLLAADRPDAFLVLTDGLVPDTAAACRRLGLTPGRELDLVGYDNYILHPSISSMRQHEGYLPVATIDQRLGLLGRALVEALCDRAADRLPPVPLRRLMPVRVVELAG